MIVALANPKGGVGKSTLATNLATMFAAKDRSTLLFDTDGQGSARKWGALRESLGIRPKIPFYSQTGDMYVSLEVMADAVDVVVVDTAGKRGPELALVLALADVVIVPVTPSQFDVWALDDIADVLESLTDKGAEFKTHAVINNTSYNPKSRDVKATRGALKAYEAYFAACETHIVGKQVFKDALLTGQGVIEMDGGLRDEKATVQLWNFFKEIFE